MQVYNGLFVIYCDTARLLIVVIFLGRKTSSYLWLVERRMRRLGRLHFSTKNQGVLQRVLDYC